MKARPTVSLTDDSTSERAIAWRAFFRTTSQLNSILERRLKRSVRLALSDYHVLLALWEAPEQTLRMGQLAERVAFSPSRVSYIVAHLEKDGFVTRETAPGDRRGFDATLTKPGLESVLQAVSIHQDLVRELVLGDMDEKTLDSLVAFLTGIEERLEIVKD